MVKSVGVEDPKPRHQCQHCGEAFEGQEFSRFMATLRGSALTCIRCVERNYLVPRKNLLYYLVWLLSIGAGLCIFMFMSLLLPAATMREGDGVFVISGLFIFMGAALGIGCVHFIMRVYNWMTGTFSDDRVHASSWDVY